MLARGSAILGAMVGRSSRSSVASAAAAGPASLTAGPSNGLSTSPADEMALAAKRKTKRARYIPPPLESDPSVSSMVKQEVQEVEDNLANTSSDGRYSLRRRRISATATDTNGTEAGANPTSATATPDRKSKGKARVKDEDSDSETEPLKPSSARKKPKSEPKDPFSTSPRKTGSKPIKLDLEEHEAFPAPKRWEAQYDVLTRQRRRIVAPVDTMGCQENGKDDRRRDVKQESESAEDIARRERFTILVSLMLSSQTKDPVTAEAVYNLQRNLPNGLCLQSILDASQDDISSNINKVGFWRRKTGYIQSAAQILRDDFDGDVPKTIDELCSLPGVGPKMGFLALQGAWKINIGIGVDVHVHRVANRLKWVKSTDPEGTRLQLQSWLPKELHPTINKTLVGFGQVICVPVGPRCDLCALGAARLCPSYRRVDAKSVASRVKVELLPEEGDAVDGGQLVQRLNDASDDADIKAENGVLSQEYVGVASAGAIALNGPEGTGIIMVKPEDATAAADNDAVAAAEAGDGPLTPSRPRRSQARVKVEADDALAW